jgi:hypothetical protein
MKPTSSLQMSSEKIRGEYNGYKFCSKHYFLYLILAEIYLSICTNDFAYLKPRTQQ